MPEALLSLQQVSMNLGPQPVLRNLSLNIPSGQTLAIIGESGCGKTVLLKLLVGLLQPTAGHVHFAGQALPTQTPAQRQAMRQRVGFLFQGAALFDSLNVFDNVAYPVRALRGTTGHALRQHVRQCLAEVGLNDAVETKLPAELSGGMRKRVGLARALALQPDVMLYDEPTTGLDPVIIDTINDLIDQTRQRRPMTSVLVTHEMKTVKALADRVVMLAPLAKLEADAPQILFDGTVADLFNATDDRIRRFVA